MEIVHTSEIIIIFGLVFIEIDASYGFGGPLRGIKTQSVIKIVPT
jgi:hypothetical protein